MAMVQRMVALAEKLRLQVTGQGMQMPAQVASLRMLPKFA
jgi:EAL domain-containing protein (putative c-di-GMP-specific phosphodiesterase class I)